MSLNLVSGDLRVKTFDDKKVLMGGHEISMSDFCTAVMYVLTNTDLGPEDPRRPLIRSVSALVETDGYNVGGKRLALLKEVLGIPQEEPA